MKAPLTVAVLISGRGSNLKALIDGAESYKIASVISDNPEAAGLNFAREASIPCSVFPRADFPSRQAQKTAIFEALKREEPDLVALAGFMLILQEELVRHFQGRVINIHPSLLPKFQGLDTHTRVLQAGEKRHGCTVHFVDAGVDSGPMVAQASCECFEEDTPETLAARVLKLEHAIYPWTANMIALRQIGLEGSKVTYAPECIIEAKEKGFNLSC
ncbi:MAG: phosphoribosylglycinamide formyltransferase [Proteobacteria bacterium]|nr:MAG: phosphoribosylglycinamide formyltransferase [Pseudomonadota bacterium]